MYQRVLNRPKKTFFLLGPRGTGKSTWLKQTSFDLVIDLLNSRTRVELERDPHHLVSLCTSLKSGDWVLIDEVQKVPALLDEVHSLYENQRLNFALSGSSARKLKRSGANLLAGRAINCRMYPLVRSEYGTDISLSDRIQWGTLPLVIDNFAYKEDTLEAYIDNYLRQELTEEGVIRNLAPFLRFLQVAAILNGQILNTEGVARDSQVGRTTVDKYFQVLFDTLIAFPLPAYQPGLKIKETAHPKIYFFDSGVARAAAGLTRLSLDNFQLGYCFETFVLNEIRAYNDYSKRHRPLFYYGLAGRGEIDLIIQLEPKTTSHPDKVIALEIKLGKSWKSDWGRMLESFKSEKSKTRVERTIGIYDGDSRLRQGTTDVFPVDTFLKELHNGKIF